MLIVDASALYEVVTSTRLGMRIGQRMAIERDFGAPSVVDVEVYGVIRLKFLQGRLDGTAARQAIDDLRSWPGDRYDHRDLLGRAWELRNNVRGWDAFYVALAEALDAALLTTDGRLSRAPGLHCPVELMALPRSNGR
jgi:predicted nucleic acid-binding protein